MRCMLVATHLHLVYLRDMKQNSGAVLKESGLKVTPPLVPILEVFSANCRPVTTEVCLTKERSRKMTRGTDYGRNHVVGGGLVKKWRGVFSCLFLLFLFLPISPLRLLASKILLFKTG